MKSKRGEGLPDVTTATTTVISPAYAKSPGPAMVVAKPDTSKGTVREEVNY